MESLGIRDMPKETRERILRARVNVSTPRQLKYLEMDTKRRYKHGVISEHIHDFIIDLIAERRNLESDPLVPCPKNKKLRCDCYLVDPCEDCTVEYTERRTS